MKRRIELFIHCRQCVLEDHAGASGASHGEAQQVEVGWTKEGLQVWCKRHDRNVLHLDFEGRKIAIASEEPS